MKMVATAARRRLIFIVKVVETNMLQSSKFSGVGLGFGVGVLSCE
jgi:hypothetical protein